MSEPRVSDKQLDHLCRHLQPSEESESWSSDLALDLRDSRARCDELAAELAAIEAGTVSIAAAIDMETNDLRSQLAAMHQERDEAIEKCKDAEAERYALAGQVAALVRKVLSTHAADIAGMPLVTPPEPE